MQSGRLFERGADFVGLRRDPPGIPVAEALAETVWRGPRPFGTHAFIAEDGNEECERIFNKEVIGGSVGCEGGRLVGFRCGQTGRIVEQRVCNGLSVDLGRRRDSGRRDADRWLWRVQRKASSRPDLQERVQGPAISVVLAYLDRQSRPSSWPDDLISVDNNIQPLISGRQLVTRAGILPISALDHTDQRSGGPVIVRFRAFNGWHAVDPRHTVDARAAEDVSHTESMTKTETTGTDRHVILPTPLELFDTVGPASGEPTQFACGAEIEF